MISNFRVKLMFIFKIKTACLASTLTVEQTITYTRKLKYVFIKTFIYYISRHKS